MTSFQLSNESDSAPVGSVPGTSLRGFFRYLATGHKLVLAGLIVAAALIVGYGIFRALTATPYGAGGAVGVGLFFLTRKPWDIYVNSVEG